MRIQDCLLYITVQIVAAFCAGGMAAYVEGGVSLIGSPIMNLEDHSLIAVISVEFIFSMMLVLTVLNTATNENVSGNSYFGIAIGFAITSGIVIVNDISGGVFNPAVGIALPAITGVDADRLWVYVIGDFMGAALAALIYVFWHWQVPKPRTISEQNQKPNPSELRNALLDGIVQ